MPRRLPSSPVANDNAAPDPAAGQTRPGRCPICKSATKTEFRPFCSRRCADVDLARWLGGTYAIAGSEDGEEDGTPGVAAAESDAEESASRPRR